MTRNVASERGNRKFAERLALDAKLEQRVVEALMAHTDGRRWVWLWLTEAQLFGEDDGVDPYQMAFDKGTRRMGRKLLRAVTTHAPAAYITMTEENTAISLRLQQDPDDAQREPDASPE